MVTSFAMQGNGFLYIRVVLVLKQLLLCRNVSFYGIIIMLIIECMQSVHENMAKMLVFVTVDNEKLVKYNENTIIVEILYKRSMMYEISTC